MKHLKKNNKCQRHIACYEENFTVNIPEAGMYVVMEYIETNCNLRSMQYDSTFSIIKLIKESVEAIEFMHQEGIAHRDIHPSNIVYDVNQNRYVFVDYGLSCHSIKCHQTNNININIYCSKIK